MKLLIINRETIPGIVSTNPKVIAINPSSISSIMLMDLNVDIYLLNIGHYYSFDSSLLSIV